MIKKLLKMGLGVAIFAVFTNLHAINTAKDQLDKALIEVGLISNGVQSMIDALSRVTIANPEVVPTALERAKLVVAWGMLKDLNGKVVSTYTGDVADDEGE